MSRLQELSEELEEALAMPISILGGPARSYAAPNAAAVDLENTKDYSELLARPETHATVDVQGEDGDGEDVVDVGDEFDDDEEISEGNVSLRSISSIVAALISSHEAEGKLNSAIRQTGVKDPEEVKSLSKAFREALLIRLAAVVPLAMRDVGIGVAKGQVVRAQRDAKNMAKTTLQIKEDRRLRESLAAELGDLLAP